jgi:competence ComEA-like helix-hairpin-helix protein
MPLDDSTKRPPMNKRIAEKWTNGLLGVLILLSLALFFRQLSAFRGRRPVVEIKAPASSSPGGSRPGSPGDFSRPPDSASPAETTRPEKSFSARIDLNTASAETLTALPGIGPKLAGALVRHRNEHGPFTRYADLLEVPGIGEKRAEQIKPRVVPLAETTAPERSEIAASEHVPTAPAHLCPRCKAPLRPTCSRNPHYKPYCPNCLFYLRNSDSGRGAESSPAVPE